MEVRVLGALTVRFAAPRLGGRHYDVTVAAGPEEFRLRALSATHGAWLRTADEGSPVVISFFPEDMHVYPITSDASPRTLTGATA